MKFERRKKRVLRFPSFWISTLGFITCKYSILLWIQLKTFCLSITWEAKPSTKVEDEASLVISNLVPCNQDFPI